MGSQSEFIKKVWCKLVKLYRASTLMKSTVNLSKVRI